MMDYAERGNLADSLRGGKLRRADGAPDLAAIVQCLQDIANGVRTLLCARLTCHNRNARVPQSMSSHLPGRPRGDGELNTSEFTDLPGDLGLMEVVPSLRIGMDYLHGAGILHGDLKPANVLLKPAAEDTRGFICKLCDFGLSHVLDATEDTHVVAQIHR